MVNLLTLLKLSSDKTSKKDTLDLKLSDLKNLNTKDLQTLLKTLKAKGVDLKTLDLKELGINEATLKELDIKSLDLKTLDFKKPNAKELDLKETNAKKLDLKALDTKNIDTKELKLSEKSPTKTNEPKLADLKALDVKDLKSPKSFKPAEFIDLKQKTPNINHKTIEKLATNLKNAQDFKATLLKTIENAKPTQSTKQAQTPTTKQNIEPKLQIIKDLPKVLLTKPLQETKEAKEPKEAQETKLVPQPKEPKPSLEKAVFKSLDLKEPNKETQKEVAKLAIKEPTKEIGKEVVKIFEKDLRQKPEKTRQETKPKQDVLTQELKTKKPEPKQTQKQDEPIKITQEQPQKEPKLQDLLNLIKQTPKKAAQETSVKEAVPTKDLQTKDLPKEAVQETKQETLKVEAPKLEDPKIKSTKLETPKLTQTKETVQEVSAKEALLTKDLTIKTVQKTEQKAPIVQTKQEIKPEISSLKELLQRPLKEVKISLVKEKPQEISTNLEKQAPLKPSLVNDKKIEIIETKEAKQPAKAPAQDIFLEVKITKLPTKPSKILEVAKLTNEPLKETPKKAQKELGKTFEKPQDKDPRPTEFEMKAYFVFASMAWNFKLKNSLKQQIKTEFKELSPNDKNVANLLKIAKKQGAKILFIKLEQENGKIIIFKPKKAVQAVQIPQTKAVFSQEVKEIKTPNTLKQIIKQDLKQVNTTQDLPIETLQKPKEAQITQKEPINQNLEIKETPKEALKEAIQKEAKQTLKELPKETPKIPQKEPSKILQNAAKTLQEVRLRQTLHTLSQPHQIETKTNQTNPTNHVQPLRSDNFEIKDLQETSTDANTQDNNQNAQTQNAKLEAKPVNTSRFNYLLFGSRLKEVIKNYKPPISKLSLEVEPKNLGRVNLTIKTRGKRIEVEISSSKNTIQIMQQGIMELKTSLSNLGFKDVLMHFGSDDGQSGQRKEQEKEKQKEDEFTISFEEPEDIATN